MGLLIRNRGIMMGVLIVPKEFDFFEPLNFFAIHLGFVFFQSKY
jgi:hypothetical protein